MNGKYVQQGLYRREYEHDACGVGMVANLSGEANHDIVEKGMTILKRLMHRGATGNDPETGDGAGLLMRIPHGFFKKVLGKSLTRIPQPKAVREADALAGVRRREIFRTQNFSASQRLRARNQPARQPDRSGG